MSAMTADNVFSITINGALHTIDLTRDPISPHTSLATYIRTQTTYHGTKIACGEGGCGACTVALTYFDVALQKTVTRPVNSCLARILSLNGASVATNDYIGNKIIGYHPIQKKLAELNGTQCGYCASGMVMLLYCYLQENANPTPAEVEAILDGNLCRCTGYRPILDTFKSFATTTSLDVNGDAMTVCRKENCCQRQNKALFDLEDSDKLVKDNEMHSTNSAPSRIVSIHNTSKASSKRTNKVDPAPPSYDELFAPSRPQTVSVAKTSNIWQDCATITDLVYWMNHYSDLQVMLTVGATSLAIYSIKYDVTLNIAAIPELNVLSQSSTGITIGAANTIKNVIDYLGTVTATPAYRTAFIPQLIKHLNRLAGYSIRCRASIGGNLMITRQHQQPDDFFPSDAAVVLLGLNATVNVLNVATNTTTNYSFATFLSMDFTSMVLVSIEIPFNTSLGAVFNSYKVAKRQVMSHAFVNCAFNVTVSPVSNTIISQPIIAVGGIYTLPTRVSDIETGLLGVKVTDTATLLSLCDQLASILTANVAPQGGRQQYRVQTAVNYLYKFLLSLQPSLPSTLSRATENWLSRPVTSSSQSFSTNPSTFPVSQPMNKIDGLTQTAGEALFTADIPAPQGLLHGAVVQTSQANATISYIDPTVVKDVDGFVKFYDSSSIPSAQNTFGVAQLFATGTSNYAGQCAGFVVAVSQHIARKCAKMIEETIQYSSIQPPVLTVAEAIAANNAFPGVTFTPVQRGDATAAFAKCAKVVTNTLNIGSQYHCHLENNAAMVRPVEGMFLIDAASQSPVNCQQVVATVLGIPSSLVQVNTRRCGGGFGAKQTNSNFTASLAAIASQDLQLPVLLELSLQDPMRGLGARPLYQYTYKTGLDANNKIIAFEGDIAMSTGFTSPDCEGEASTALTNLDNCYNIPNYTVSVTMYQTNIAPCTSVRGPGWIQAIVLAEMMMNDVANQLSIDPVAFREANFYVQGNSLPTGMPLTECNLEKVWNTCKTSANYVARSAEVAAFNKANKFVKRGLSINPTRFGVDWTWCNYNASVAVYADGSIAITHGGVELGQGINTKVTQACAFKFGLTADDMPTIRVLTATTRCAPNPTNITGGSVTSELCSLAVMHCCEILNERLAPYRAQFPDSWVKAAGAAAGANVNMYASSVAGQPRTPLYVRYNTWGTAISEVELDGLTGQFEIKRTDLVYDCGTSLNPYVDLGQVEGGFTFGLGWFTQETVHWDATTGAAKDATTWEYKPPMACDIPEVFNVTLLENSFNASGVVSSKASGEPPVALSISVVQALESAINAVRAEVGASTIAVTSLPLGVDVISEQCGVTSSEFVFS